MDGSCKQIWKGKGEKYKLCTLHHVEAEHFAAFYHLGFLWLENARNAGTAIIVILSIVILIILSPSWTEMKKEKNSITLCQWRDAVKCKECPTQSADCAQLVIVPSVCSDQCSWLKEPHGLCFVKSRECVLCAQSAVVQCTIVNCAQLVGRS